MPKSDNIRDEIKKFLKQYDAHTEFTVKDKPNSAPVLEGRFTIKVGK